MFEGFWFRIFGLYISFALVLDVYRTIHSIGSVRVRNRIKVIAISLQILNIAGMIVEIFTDFFCPIQINLLAVFYYLAKVLAGYLHCIRAELAVRHYKSISVRKNIITGVKAYLLIVLALNISKALFVYKSFRTEDGGCSQTFGNMFWMSIDDVMFVLLDLMTMSMLYYFYRNILTLSHVNGKRDPTKNAVFRLLWVSIIPLASSASAILNLQFRPSSAYFIGSADFQVHMLCLYLVYSWRRTKVKHTSMQTNRGALAQKILFQSANAAVTIPKSVMDGAKPVHSLMLG